MGFTRLRRDRFQAYSYERKDQHPTQEANRDFKQKLGIESFFYQGGLG
jgi:hypothetical protein